MLGDRPRGERGPEGPHAGSEHESRPTAEAVHQQAPDEGDRRRSALVRGRRNARPRRGASKPRPDEGSDGGGDDQPGGSDALREHEGAGDAPRRPLLVGGGHGLQGATGSNIDADWAVIFSSGGMTSAKLRKAVEEFCGK